MLFMKCQNRAGLDRPPERWWQKAQSGRHAKTLGGARAQVPVYRQQRPEDSKIGTQSAAKSGRPEQQRKHHGATAKQQGGGIQGGRGDGVTVGQTLSAASPRVQESAMVSGLFSLASRSRDKPARKGVLFLF